MSSEGNVGRRKSRQACEQCRHSKRKCDGKEPCYSCRRYEHICSYSSRPRRRARIQGEKRSEEHLSPTTSVIQNDEVPTAVPEVVEKRSAKQISSVAPVPSGNTFARHLMAELSNGETQPLEYSSWNLGLRLDSAYETSIIDLAGLEEASLYSQVYFEKVNPVYSIVDQGRFGEQLQDRWTSSSSQSCEFDAIICGVIALGSLFSGANAFHRESQIVELGQKLLERWTPVDRLSRSSLPIATARILRVLYLRMAVDPRAAWQASRSSILALEGHSSDDTRNEQDSRCSTGNATSLMDEAQIHRKLHWIARLLDRIRNEFHPSQWDRDIVTISCPPPTPSPPGILDHTSTLISLYVVSLRFTNSPEHKSLAELTKILDDIDALPMSSHDALQLHKSNHALCIYRFMRLTSSVIPKRTLARILCTAKPGLAGAVRLAKDSQPW
ncbi:hypothetical protein BU16DRAFT_529267 [Lophium mytilinum]|uniref:Zn(2)-C6 fungal-type domain-containing protein n=1 Tax=Lophium mytilinum TaxID=390894 RepID=A0A6A6QKP9_9PEZI|nr:hypothetical protein BU16DRAFT_529267 [Lophium mytilinum]